MAHIAFFLTKLYTLLFVEGSTIHNDGSYNWLSWWSETTFTVVIRG